jgi:YHS domain-containing protein
MNMYRGTIVVEPDGHAPSADSEGAPALPQSAPAPEQRMKGGESTMAKDPVCGMEVNPEQAAGQSEYQGQTYYFCSRSCKQQFDQNPERYTSQDIAQQ